MNKFSLFFSMIVFATITFSQSVPFTTQEIRYDSDDHGMPTLISFDANDRPNISQLDEVLRPFFKGKMKFRKILLKSENDEIGFTHYTFKQVYSTYPIEFSEIRVHIKENKIHSINGNWINKAPTSNHSKLNISEEQALSFALRYIGAEKYKWELDSEESFLRKLKNNQEASYFPHGKLTFAGPAASIRPTGLELCYKFDVYAHKPLSRTEIYVSAVDGEIIFTNSLIHSGNVQGTAVTAYSGHQLINTDSVTPAQFNLQQTLSGNGVATYNMSQGTSYGAAVNFTDFDNFWNNSNAQLDQYATDAHWGAEKTYDYFLSKHGRNSIDNNGFSLNSFVHYDNSFANAFWDGQVMTYGDGAGQITPLTALDIAGHEISHGLTTFSADLIYESESGALNESFSDIFGTAIEFYGRPGNANWTIGEDIGVTLRSMSSPGTYGDPDTRNGNNWINVVGCTPIRQNDYCGVHTNSGVQNFWFYLLATGGSGVNDLGNSYSVSGIGIDKAASIAFRNLTVYLGRTSDYDDARLYSIISAIDLYGACSPEVESVTDAWHAVGVGNAYQQGVNSRFGTVDSTSCSPPHSVNFVNQSSNGVSFSWDFGDGSTSSEANPTHTFQNYGQYDIQLIVDGGSCGRDTLLKSSYIKVDPVYLCSEILEDGFNQDQTGCKGLLYDSGGNVGNYGNNEAGVITIEPSGASSITLNFLSFDIEAGSASVCDYDYLEIFDGANTSAPLIGKYCNTTGSPGTITSSTGAITLRFFSDQFVTRAGFEISWSCSYPNIKPDADFMVNRDSSCSGRIQFTDESNYNPNSWIWNFGDGTTSNLQNPIHNYTQNGTFSVKLITSNNFGADTIIQPNLIKIDRPQIPSVSVDTICYGQPASIGLSASGNFRWFQSNTSDTEINNGNSISTSNLFADTTFWVEKYIPAPSLNVGPPNNNIGTGGYGSFDRHLIFDVFKPVTLESVKIYAGSGGNRVIELRDNNGTILQSRMVFLSSGLNTVGLDFDLSPGVDYQIGLPINGFKDLYRTNSGLNYPYNIQGVISIKRSNASIPMGYYYYFYDWSIKEEECLSTRVPVKVKVDSSCSLTGVNKGESKEYRIKMYPNPSNGRVFISFNSIQDLENISIIDLSGKKVYEAEESLNNMPSGKFEVYLPQLENGLYIVSLQFDGKVIRKKLTLIK